MTTTRQSAWILHAIDRLQRHGSWTGRIHLHKHLFLAKELLGLNHPFDFDLYKFGPYSFQLDSTILELETCGIISSESRAAGYGPSYSLAESMDSVLPTSLDLSEDEIASIESIAAMIGNKNSAALEVIATCQWAIGRENLDGDDDIISRVSELKPKYPREVIREHLSELRAMRKEIEVQ